MSAEEQKLRTYLEKLTTALRHSKARQQKLEGELERHHEQLREPIALVGMACRFPGGIDSPERMWEALDAGFDATTSFPEDRGWDLDALYDADPDHAGTTITERGGFLHDAALFDPLFFGISPREAETIDPQQRVLLELSWEALERARIVPSALQGSNTGAYVGIIYQDYGGRFIATPEALNGNVWIGSSGSVSSGRLSYTLGLEGPAVSVDTACSSSLVAIHLACNALRRGECDLALAGGATIMAAPIMLIEFSRQRGLAPDGRSKAFSSAADGVGWGEGAGVVVLERLSDALAKGHPVLATIRGSAVNQDGRSQGLTAPNGPAQQRVIRAALERAGLEPDAIDLIDAHGTGTRLGDPIEAIALQRVFGKTRPPERPLYIGSLKSNTGHSQAAAGVGSLIKAVVAMQHGRMPKTLHAEDQSGEVDWEGGGVDVLAQARPWSTAAGAPRRAGVSSFGISGTNAHLVVEEHASSAATPADASADAGSFPVLLSARSKAALRGQASRLAEHLRAHPELPVPAVAQALLHTRSHFEQRAGVLASADDRASVLAGLDALAAKTPHPLTVEGSALRGGKLVFVFPGQGAQWLGMGRALLEQSKVFADTVAACAAALKPHLDWDLYSILRGDEGAPSLQREDVIQPALWTMMIALVRVWAELGVEPDAVVGHSQGEIAAACVIGALSLEEGAQIVARRSKVLSTIAGSSGMGLTSLSKAELEPLLEPYGDRLSLAVDSGPASTVVAGEVAAVDEFLATLDARGVFARRVKIDYASHTRYVEPIRPQVLESLAGLRPRRGRVPMLSTVTTDFVTGEELDAEYWYANLRNPVRFAEATRALIAAGHDHFVEVSPHPVMSVAVNATLENEGRRGAVVGSLRRQQGALEQVLLGAMGLHCAGRPVDWSALPPLAKPNTVAELPELPTYAFDRQRYWIDPPRPRVQPAAQAARAGAPSIAAPAGGDHPILAETAPLSGTTGVRVWEGQLDGERLPWVHDHQVGGATLFPGAGTMELLLGVGQALGPSAVELRDLELLEPLVLGEGSARLQVVTQESGPNEWRATLSVADSGGDAGWTALARATLHRANPDASDPGTLDALRGRLEVQRSEDLYDRLRAAGLEYGSAFQGLRELALAPADDGVLEGLARVRLDTELPALAPAARTGFAIHPAALDAAFHLAAAAILDQHPDQGTFVPTAMERLEWYAGDDDRPLAADPSGDLWVHARLRRGAEGGRFLADFELRAADGQRLGRLTGLALDSLDPRGAASTQPSSLLQLRWQTHPEPAPAAVPLGRWLVLGGGPSTEAIASALRERGATVEVHAPSALTTPLVRAFVEGAEAAKERAGVLVLAALELPSFDEASADPSYPRTRAAEPAWASTLAAVRELAAIPARTPPRLVLVTCQAHAVATSINVNVDVDPLQTLAWGLGGPLRSEHGGLRPLRVDLGARPSAPEDPEVRALVELLARDGDEDQVALRSAEVFVARLERAPVPAAAKGRKVAAGQRAFRVEIGQPGLLESIALTAFDRPALEPGQVEIAVEAVGMNFRDVLLANGVIPPVGSERVLLGFECAGTVARVGEGVDGLEPGQRVFGIAFDSFATHAVTRAELVVPLPERLSMAEGATLPIVHLTTYVSLHETARLRPGERVLIHSATGGVGLSALQWAQHVGAEIYATAGSETKRDWLREQGVKWVSDSRSLRFVDDIRRWTRDEAAAGKGEPGVDVVLNALAGELMHGSLGLLRRGGRFIELGLRGALSNERIGLAPFANNLAYFLVNLADLTVHAPARAGTLLRELVPLLEQDVLRPLPILPHLMSRVGDAMWEMARGRHIGKFVVHVDGTEAAREAFPDAPPVRVNVPRGASLVRGDRSYLITGGLGGLGLELAKRLAERGAGALVLLSRRGVTQDHQREAIAAMREAGVVVETPSVDVSDRAALEAEFEAIAASPRPLGGIVHTAGVLADAMAVDLRPEDFERSFAPKVAGAWHLDELSRSHAPELELFVLYSSVAGILGNPGQTNYSAANAFLDGLAARRRRAGLPAHAIAWGVFDEVGFATGDARRGARLAARGLTPLRPAEGLDLFEQVVAGDEALLAPCPFDAHKWAGFYTEAASWPFFAELLVREAGDQGGRAEDELSERLRQVSTREARPILLEHVLEQLAQVIRIDPAELDPDAPFAALGVDSLMGVELRNLVAASTGVTVPATAIWTYPTPEALTGFILEALDLEAENETREPEPAPEPTPEPAPPDEEEELLEELDDLSDEDLLALGDELLS